MTRKNKITQQDYEQLLDGTTPPPKLNITFADSKQIIFAGMLVIGLFFGLGGGWITFAEITGAVIAQGEVRVDTERKTVEHLEGGIVHEILVRNGDHVTKGQTLLVLESARVVASTDQIALQLAASQIEETRLLAERDFTEKLQWRDYDQEVDSGKISALRLSAQTVFSSNRQALNEQIGLLYKRIDQIHVQIDSIDSQLVADSQVVDTLQEELDAKQTLYEQQFIEKTQILQLQRALADRRGSAARLHGSRAELLERIAEFELQIQTLKSEYRQKAIARLAEVQQVVYDLQQRLLPLKDARRRLEVTAPVAGEVVAMQIHSQGGVVKPGQPILDIVPDDSPLIVETSVQVTDITHIYEGQIADVQLLAFPTRTTPKIKAEVVYISADRILKQTPYGEQPTYVVYVELNRKELEENKLYLSAGMPAAVYINTEPRTVLDYALEPMLQNFDRALREN